MVSTEIDLDEVLATLEARDPSGRAVEQFRLAAASLADADPHAEAALELDDLLVHLRDAGWADVAEAVRAAIQEIGAEKERSARLRDAMRPLNRWAHPAPAAVTGYGDARASARQLFLDIAHAHEGPSAIRRARYLPIADLVRPGERVVDIGCGDGTFLDLVRERGATGIGIDLDPEKVAAAQSRGLQAHCGRAQEIDWSAWGDINFVSMLHIVEHIPSSELVEILHHVAGALASNGRLFVLTPNISHPTVQVNFWLDITHVRPYPELILGTMMQAMGFSYFESGTMSGDLETWCYGYKRPEHAVRG